MIRRWSDHVYAVYVEDGLFGRRVGLVDEREEAENVAPQSLRAEQNAGSNKRRMNAPGGSVAQPPDDLSPDCDSEPRVQRTRTPRQTRVANPTAGG